MRDDWSREPLPSPFRPDVRAWTDSGLHAAWLGHSTTLISLDGFTILTDPVFSLRAGLSVGHVSIGIKRLIEPALSIRDLPAVDLILLSHAHMDHFDIPSLRELEGRRTTVVTAKRTSDLLRLRRYAAVHELGWGEKVRVGPATVSAFPVAHWGARMRSDVYRGFNGYVVETERFKILFGGDTAFTTSFESVRSSKQIDLAVMPIGAYDPWIHVHCNPEQALQMADAAGADFILPIHHQTFHLSNESKYEPIDRLITAAGKNSERVCLREVGEEFHL